jgi:hypothetical protein
MGTLRTKASGSLAGGVPCSQFGGFAFLSCTKRTQLTAGQSVKIVIVLGGADEEPGT